MLRAVSATLLLMHLGSAAGHTLNSGHLSLSIDDGYHYTVSIDSELWFDSRGEALGFSFSADQTLFSLQNSTLRPAGEVQTGNSSDNAGPFDFLTIPWARTAASSPEWLTTFKAYRNRNALTFVQHWPGALTGTIGSTFPSLRQVTPKRLGVLEYTGSSCGFMVAARGSFPGISGGQGKGYSVIAPQDTTGAGSAATLAIGPSVEPFVNQARNAGGSLCYGMADSFSAVPAGYTIETVLVSSARSARAERASVPSGGVNAALFEYGDLQLSLHKKQRARGDHRRETEYLGYSTTAFYFYNLCDCLDPPPLDPATHKPAPHVRRNCSRAGSPIPAEFLQRSGAPGSCSTYEDTLLAVDAGLKAQGIPYEHMLLDSWWYGEGIFGGARYWEDVPECVGAAGAGTFPRGLQAFQRTINKTLWVHNGEWTPDTPYRSQYSFEEGGPPQGSGLWDHLFGANAQGWGLSTIKQDHMGQQMQAGADNWRNVSVLRSWLEGMGQAAAANDVGVLYCCAPPNVHMSGVGVPAAYAVRASPDYVWQASGQVLKLPTVQWAIGPDNAFHWNGLGLLPYKDTFFSNSSMSQQAARGSTDPAEWPPFHGYHERDAQTHALMSLLSMAHVTFGDAVGQSNRSLLMQLVRQDGMLLKADRPATAIDRQFQAMMFGSWPGQLGPPTVDGVLSVAVCGSSVYQRWLHDKQRGSLALDAPGGGCLDISHCSREPGAAVQLYSGGQGYVCAKPGQPGSCDAQNERWSLVPNNSSSNPVSVLRSNWSGLCLRVETGVGGTTAECDFSDPHQQWEVGPAANGSVTLSTPSHDDELCLTGRPPSAAVWHGFDSEAELETEAERLFPTGLSRNTKKAYAISARWMEKAEEGKCLEQDQCDRGLGAPQGPLGEVYSTHTTVSNITWRFVVAVQLSVEFNLTTHDLGLAESSDVFVRYAWDDAKTFHPETSDELKLFGPAHPLQLHRSTGSLCHTGAGAMNITTECFPIQWHAVAPVLPNGWVVLGEVGKMMPISNQRLSAVSLVAPSSASSGGVRVDMRGAPGEVVELGAAPGAAATPVYQSCAIGSDGTATIQFTERAGTMEQLCS